jgi:hypothetical protein
MMFRKARVYIASKLAHAEKWRQLFAGNEVECSASWIHEIKNRDDNSAGDCIFGWRQNRLDVLGSDYVIVYSEPGETLRGALIEAGVAIGVGIQVFVVGPLDGTWHHSPFVSTGWKSVEQVLRHIVSTTYLRETQRPDFVEPADEVEKTIKRAFDPETMTSHSQKEWRRMVAGPEDRSLTQRLNSLKESPITETWTDEGGVIQKGTASA